MNFEEKNFLINSYFMANFNYCPLIWILFGAGPLKKISPARQLSNRPVRENCKRNMIIPGFSKVSYGKTSLRIFCSLIFHFDVDMLFLLKLF